MLFGLDLMGSIHQHDAYSYAAMASEKLWHIDIKKESLWALLSTHMFQIIKTSEQTRLLAYSLWRTAVHSTEQYSHLTFP